MYVIAKNAALEIMEHYKQRVWHQEIYFPSSYHIQLQSLSFLLPERQKTKRPVYTMIERAMRGETLEVWGDPNYSKTWSMWMTFSQELCLAAFIDRDGGFITSAPVIPFHFVNKLKLLLMFSRLLRAVLRLSIVLSFHQAAAFDGCSKRQKTNLVTSPNLAAVSCLRPIKQKWLSIASHLFE